MRGRTDMESYEEFCLRSLVLLQEERKLRKKCEPFFSLKAQSAICFYGRAVLSPLVRKKKDIFLLSLVKNMGAPSFHD